MVDHSFPFNSSQRRTELTDPHEPPWTYPLIERIFFFLIMRRREVSLRSSLTLDSKHGYRRTQEAI